MNRRWISTRESLHNEHTLSCLRAVSSVAHALLAAGCHAPGKPTLRAEAARPDQVLGLSRRFISRTARLAMAKMERMARRYRSPDPVYLRFAGVDNIQRITASGVPGTSMPPFGKGAGGMLTDQQIAAHRQRNDVDTWGASRCDSNPLPYASAGSADVAKGRASYSTFCARCHGADGTGIKRQQESISARSSIRLTLH